MEVFTPKLIPLRNADAGVSPKCALLVSEQQMALAGYRLAALFNQLFDGGAASVGDARQPANCQIIRRVPYPVTQIRAEQKLEIVLLNLCPADAGKVARPMISAKLKNGEEILVEYDIIKNQRRKRSANIRRRE